MSKLILTRHGQSVWNAENRFTGWVDVDLSEQGILEAKKSGVLMDVVRPKELPTGRVLNFGFDSVQFSG